MPSEVHAGRLAGQLLRRKEGASSTNGHRQEGQGTGHHPVEVHTLGARPRRRVVSVTTSSITTYRTCPRKYWLAYLVGGSGVTSKLTSMALAVGTVYHEGMQYFLETGSEKTEPRIDQWLKEHQLDFSHEDKELIRAHALGLVAAHTSKIQGLAWKIPAIAEKAFALALAPGIMLRGKIDAVVERTDGLWLVEHKTRTRIEGDELTTIPTDGQVLRYAWAARKLGLMVKGIIYTLAQKSAIRGGKNETSIDKTKRIIDDYKEKGAEAIHHEVVRFGVDDISRCIDGTVDTAGEIRAKEIHKGPWPRWENACKGRHGICDFYRICMQQPWDGQGEPPLGFRYKAARFEELAEPATNQEA